VGYAGEVTCVRFAFSRDDWIIAADDQGWLYLHRLENTSVSTTSWSMLCLTWWQWQLAAKVQAHLHSIAALCDHQGIIVTGSSDATIKIWSVDETNSTRAFALVFRRGFLCTTPQANLKHHQTLQTGGRFPLDCQIAQLPGASSKMADIDTSPH